MIKDRHTIAVERILFATIASMDNKTYSTEMRNSVSVDNAECPLCACTWPTVSATGFCAWQQCDLYCVSANELKALCGLMICKSQTYRSHYRRPRIWTNNIGNCRDLYMFFTDGPWIPWHWCFSSLLIERSDCSMPKLLNHRTAAEALVCAQTTRHLLH